MRLLIVANPLAMPNQKKFPIARMFLPATVGVDLPPVRSYGFSKSTTKVQGQPQSHKNGVVHYAHKSEK